MESTHITIKELIPIVIGAAIWGKQWSGKVIRTLSVLQCSSGSSGSCGQEGCGNDATHQMSGIHCSQVATS